MGVLHFCVLLLFITVSRAQDEVEEIDDRGLETSKGGFKIYRQVQITTQKNHIRLRFKTIHATGLIMLAQGSNKKDFLSIELYRGKIRVAANYGDGPLNMLRPIKGLYTMNLGKDLADNKWHTVEFIGNIREMYLFLDNGTANAKNAFLQAPPTYHELSVVFVTFAGFYSFAPAELGSEKSLARKGLKACFSEAKFSQHYPATQEQWIDFINTPDGDLEIGEDERVIRKLISVGDFDSECARTDPPYSPMFFPSSAVHIALLQNYTIPSMKIDMKFRTVISDQTLANYTARLTGAKIQFRLDRKGRISLSMDHNENTLVFETTKENYHDGEWHSAGFEIDNKQEAVGSYQIKFSADGKTRISPIAKEMIFDGWVNIGFGFTGCMRDILINEDPVNRTRRDLKVPTEFFNITDVGVVYNQCSLKDYCNPNPCQHGSKCNQTEDNIVCDCRETLYEGSTCHRARFNYTCAGVRKSGERRSDVYYIDFDGMGPMEPVRALCDLGRTVETTTTQINNTKYLDIDATTESGKFTLDVNYAADITQMRELIMNSAHCEQYIKLTCRGVPIFRSPEGPPATWWMGGDDINHYYWGGAKNKRGYCKCGVDGNCLNIKKYCNCDDLQYLASTVRDEGNFTVKEHLPVRTVHFTKVLKATKNLEALIRVGHLRCTGFGSRVVSATFRKMWSFLSVYHPDQPFDNINAGQISFDFKTSIAYHYMTLAHARGPFSGDYIKIMIWSRTLIRILFNAGFGEFKQDISIEEMGRTFDDNQWHEFNLMFNLKELNVTVDGVRKIQGLPLQEDPFEFTVDSKPVYVGGSYHDRFGFIGSIRSLYVNGRIFDLKAIAAGQEDFGVYPGTGAACPLLGQPCNYGYCIDKYDSFACNCTVSPNDGKYCGNETNAKKFTGAQSITYDLVIGNASETIGEAIFVVGFRTKEPNVALAQLVGLDGRHVSLGLDKGFVRLDFNTKIKDTIKERTRPTYRMNEMINIPVQLNDGIHHVVRVIVSTEEVFLKVVDMKLEAGANNTESYIDPNNRNKGTYVDRFGTPIKFTIGSFDDIDGSFPPFTTSGYSGCMSGAKLIYNPKATATKRYRKSFEVDMFKVISDMRKEGSTVPKQGQQGQLVTGTFPSETDRCGPYFKPPGVLPTVGPARQFHTISPGLDISVRIVAPGALGQAVIMIVAFILAVVLLGILYVIYRLTSTNHKKYYDIKERNRPLIVMPLAAAPSSSKQEVLEEKPVIEEQLVDVTYAESKASTPKSHRDVVYAESKASTPKSIHDSKVSTPRSKHEVAYAESIAESERTVPGRGDADKDKLLGDDNDDFL